MVAFGVGEVLGCFFIGSIVDRFGSRKTCFVNIGICVSMTTVTLIFIGINEYSALAYVMCFLWGW